MKTTAGNNDASIWPQNQKVTFSEFWVTFENFLIADIRELNFSAFSYPIETMSWPKFDHNLKDSLGKERKIGLFDME